jgi:hypothetical protein
MKVQKLTAYELMIKTNYHLIKGGALTDKQKENIVGQFLSARNTPEQTHRFYNGLKYPNNIDQEGRQLYPVFYIPPYNGGKKFKSIFGQTPKTHIFSANMYELEILGLLWQLAHDNPTVSNMVDKTLIRLKTTCFGNKDDGLGECFDSSIVVLRFLGMVAPHENKWIQERIDSYNHRYPEKKRQWYSKWYYWLCLSEIPFDIAKLEIMRYKDEILLQLNKSYVMNSDFDKSINPVLVCMLRNLVARLPEYEFLKDRQPYISEIDGRLHFDVI